MGIDILHGPHQVAQKSSNTVLPLSPSRLTILPVISLSSKLGAETICDCRFVHAVAIKAPMQAVARRPRLSQECIQALFDDRFLVNAHELILDFPIFEK